MIDWHGQSNHLAACCIVSQITFKTTIAYVVQNSRQRGLSQHAAILEHRFEWPPFCASFNCLAPGAHQKRM